MTYNNTATYTSDWIENTGVMPFGINSDTVLQVKYVDGVMLKDCDFDEDNIWKLYGTNTDIDMYRYLYKGMGYKDAVIDRT
jgi:hypothetical protein